MPYEKPCVITCLHGQDLVKELRKLSDKVTRRLWIADPYIGSPTSVRQILGKEWFDSPSVSVKLLTDTSDISCINIMNDLHFFLTAYELNNLCSLL